MDHKTVMAANPNFDLSLQQIRYAYQDPINMAESLKLSKSKLPPYSSSIHACAPSISRAPTRVTEVPDLDNVTPFLSNPILDDDTVDARAGATQPPQGLVQYNQQVAFLYKNDMSIAEMILSDKVKKALETSWKFDSRACSTTAAQKLHALPHHGLSEEEYIWIKGHTTSAVRNAIKERQNEVYLAKQSINEGLKWITYDEPFPNLDDFDLDQELDDFYGPGPYIAADATGKAALNNDQVTFSDDQPTPNHEQPVSYNDQLATEYDQLGTEFEELDGDSISTTWVTWPQSNRALAEPFTFSTSYDSAIHMDDQFAAEVSKASPPQSVRGILSENATYPPHSHDEQLVGTTVDDCPPFFEASKTAPAGEENENGYEYEAPYDLSGFVSSGSEHTPSEDFHSVSDDVEMIDDECRTVIADNAVPSVINPRSEECPDSHTGHFQPARFDRHYTGYLHDGAGMNELPLAHSPVLDLPIHLHARQSYDQELSQSDNLSPYSPVYDTTTENTLDHTSTSFPQVQGVFHAHAGGSNATGPPNSPVYGDDDLAHTTVTTVRAKRDKFRNLIPLYNSDEEGFIEVTSPETPTTASANGANFSAPASAGDFDNPYDHRHFLSPTTPRYTGYGSNFHSIGFTPINAHTPTIVSASLHDPPSPSTLPPSSPPLLPYTPDPFAQTLRTDFAQFTAVTSTPLKMMATASVSPSPAPKRATAGSGSQICSGIQATNNDETTTFEDKQATNKEIQDSTPSSTAHPIKDVFNVQRNSRRRVGRPVGSKTAKRIAAAKKADTDEGLSPQVLLSDPDIVGGPIDPPVKSAKKPRRRGAVAGQRRICKYAHAVEVANVEPRAKRTRSAGQKGREGRV